MRWVTLSTDRDLVVLSAVRWKFGFCGFSTVTTTATSTATATATATAERLFEAPRFNDVEVLSAVRWRFYGSTDLRVLSTDLRGFLSTVRFGSVVSLVVFRTSTWN